VGDRSNTARHPGAASRTAAARPSADIGERSDGDQIMKMPSFVAGAFAALLLITQSVVFAQGTTGPNTPAPAKKAVASRIDQRIKSLRTRLKITTAEEPQWAAVAQVIRDNADAVGVLIRQRREKAGTMNAVDDLRSYQAIAEAHAAGTAKLVSAFEALYAVMPPDQQKIADAVFAKAGHRPAARRKKKPN
jgi:periplasmic protein CpxP/Spy